MRISALPSLNTLLVPALIDNFARLAAGSIEENVEDNQTHYVIRRGNREIQIELQQTSDAIAVQNLIEHRSDLTLITRDLTKDEADRQQQNSHQSIWPAPDSAVIALDAYVPTVSRNPGQTSFDVENIASVDHVPVYPREIVKRALELDASALILIHNHPSGDRTPSQQDIAMTERIVSAADAVGIAVHDHLVIGKSSEVSFRSEGLI